MATVAVEHPEAVLVDPAKLVLAQAAAEQRLGRVLTEGERRIDLVSLDRSLAAGKQRLAAAIEQERRRAASRYARAALADRTPEIRLRTTSEIRSALRGLYDVGVAAARGELRRAGYDPDALPKHLAALPVKLAAIEGRLGGRLDALGRETEHRLAVAVDLSEATHASIVKAVRTLPGVLSVAADFTTLPAYAGLGSVWDEASAAGVVSAWTYSAVMDNATCDPCAEMDGTSYDSWDAIQVDLPDGGPYDGCDGGDRCRCRAVPEFGSSGDAGATGGGGDGTGDGGDLGPVGDGEFPPLDEGDAAAQIVGRAAPAIPSSPESTGASLTSSSEFPRPTMEEFFNTDDLSRSWVENLSRAQEDAAKGYTDRGDRAMNTLLRGGDLDGSIITPGVSNPASGYFDSRDDVLRTIGNLRDAIADAPPLPDETTLYRGVNPFSADADLRARWEALPPDEKWSLDRQRELIDEWLSKNAPVDGEIQVAGGGFQSFTLDSGRAASWSGSGPNTLGVVFRVDGAESGASLSTLSRHPEEAEYLVSDAVRYRVVGIEDAMLPMFDGSADVRAVVVRLEEVPAAAEETVAERLAPTDLFQPIKGGTRSPDLIERRAKVEDALASLDRLIELPDLSNVPDGGIPIKFRTSSTYYGQFKFRSGGAGPTEISIANGDHAALTFAHEFGHLLDYSYLSSEPGFLMKNPLAFGRATAEVQDAFRALDEAWQESAAYQHLGTIPDAFSRAARSRAELWARSFAQWSARQSGDSILAEDLDLELLKVAEKWAQFEADSSYRFYPMQWQEDDFAAIGAAVEGLLRAVGILRV